jgi:alcohol dehydrogenase (cytochrome c)
MTLFSRNRRVRLPWCAKGGDVGRVIAVVVGLVCAVTAASQQRDAASLATPPTTSWPTYNGDYSGRRYSPLTKITPDNVNALTLAWVARLNAGSTAGGGTVKSTPVQVGGMIYVTVPDHVWAIDARTGRQDWHFIWASHGGNHLANRGVAVMGDRLFFETPDCNLVSLNVTDGTERWHTSICDLDRFYYGAAAPLIIGNHVITGISGDDLDNPGYIESHDPDTGERQWRWYSVPQKMGDPGSDTWPNEDAMLHGGGMTWLPPTYDPDLNLMYVTTGNPHPVMAYNNRAGSNLFTGCIVALNPDTGKMAWYFQSMPHDTHDWDAAETAVLIDGEIDGKPRKLLAQAARSGNFFVLDRTNGQALRSTEFVKVNWLRGYDAKGQPIQNPGKMPQVDGALVSPDSVGATNWWPPSFSPATGLFYVNAFRSYSVFYIYDPGANPQGWAGADRGGWSEAMTLAIDYKTGKTRWRHDWSGGSRVGIVSTAGNVLFVGGDSNDLVALNAATGDALWHARLNAPISNGPITYELDGVQYVIAAAADTLWGFVMQQPARP